MTWRKFVHMLPLHEMADTNEHFVYYFSSLILFHKLIFLWKISELWQAPAKLYSCQENWLSQLWISVSCINPHMKEYFHTFQGLVVNFSIIKIFPMRTISLPIPHRYAMTSSHDIIHNTNNHAMQIKCFITLQTHFYVKKKHRQVYNITY